MENVRYVVERDHLRDMAKVKDQIEFIEQKNKQQIVLLENRLTSF
jgi:hypothetical protein